MTTINTGIQTNSMTEEQMPTEPARSGSSQSEIDRLVGMTLPTSVRVNNDGTTEQLEMGRNASANSHNADVHEPPSVESLMSEINAHQAHIKEMQARLEQKVFSRTTGAVEGFAIAGAAREQLEQQIARRWDEVGYVVKLMEQTSEARVRWQQARAAQAAGGNETPTHDAMGEAVRRERAISELADMPGADGKPVGRLTAQREYDAAQLRAKADRLARGK